MQASRARQSTISLLVAYASLPAHHSDIRPVFEGRELSTLQRCLQIVSAVVFCFRPHPLREMAASSYWRYGMSWNRNFSNSCRVQEQNFVVNKTNRAFSSLPIDQAHKQTNKIVKGDGGAIGLTESSTQLLRWMVSGPEISRIINDFELSQELVRN